MTKREQYLALKATGGKRKIKATALLAYGDDESRFEAAVLLHEAAGIEKRALSLLDNPSLEVLLRAAVERCGCLVEGLDVAEAALAWREVEALSLVVAPSVVRAHRERIEPLYQASRRDFEELLGRAPLLRAAQFRWDLIAAPDKHKARVELEALLGRFPGEATFHLVASRAAIDERRLDEAARAVHRAGRLLPGNPLVRAHEILLAAYTLAYADSSAARAEAAEELARAHVELQREPADAAVYLGFMMASLVAYLVALHRGEDTQIHRERAGWAALQGEARSSAVLEDVHRRIEVTRSLTETLTAEPEALEDVLEKVLRDAFRGGGLTPMPVRDLAA